MHYDTHGNPKGTLRLTIREEQGHGVSLGGGVDVMPGETADFPYGMAVSLLQAGRARHAVESVAPVAPVGDATTVSTPENETTIDTPDPVEPSTPESSTEPTTADPAPVKAARPAPLKRR